MSATDQKITWARSAIRELEEAERNANREKFQYHFGAFLAFLGSLRQFMLVDRHKNWVYSNDEIELNYCACIDLRNVDVHVVNVVGSPRVEFTATLLDSMQISDSIHAVVHQKGAVEPFIAVSTSPETEVTHSPLASVTTRFFVNPKMLPPSFAVLPHSGQARQVKAAEMVLLGSTPAVDVAREALDFFESSVLVSAAKKGLLMP